MSTDPEKSGGTFTYNVKEAAQRIGVSTRTAWRLIRTNKLEAKRVSPRRVVILKSEVDRMLAQSPAA